MGWKTYYSDLCVPIRGMDRLFFLRLATSLVGEERIRLQPKFSCWDET